MSLRIALLAATLLCAGCASSEALNDPVFKQGYDLGCSMAHAPREARQALTKDKPDLFRRGFSAGFTSCGGDREIGS